MVIQNFTQCEGIETMNGKNAAIDHQPLRTVPKDIARDLRIPGNRLHRLNQRTKNRPIVRDVAKKQWQRNVTIATQKRNKPLVKISGIDATRHKKGVTKPRKGGRLLRPFVGAL
jgi:hypothetical protein